jgi:hypothetical protein
VAPEDAPHCDRITTARQTSKMLPLAGMGSASFDQPESRPAGELS